MKDSLEILQKEIVIPEVVQKKANEAFAMIQKEATENVKGERSKSAGRNPKIEMIDSVKGESMAKNRSGSNNMKKRSWKMMTAGIAATLAVGTLTVGAAAYLKWSAGLETELRVTEEQKVAAEESGLTDFPGMTVTDAGVTVTAQQSIVDNYYAYLAFKVEGYGVEAGKQPAFDLVDITVDGESVTSSHGFYDGVIANEKGEAMLADGSEIPSDENGNLLLDYTMEDGSLEYRINLANQSEKGWFIGKDVHVEFADLGVYEGKGEDVVESIQGTWRFDWTFKGDNSSYIAEVNEALGDTGAIVKEAEISPISLRVVYEWPRQEITETGYHESQEEVDGEMVQSSEPFEYTYYAEPPQLTGVKLKDGTFLPYLYMGPGSEGYQDETADSYENRFVKKYPEGEEELTEENFYVVDIR